MKVQIAFAGAVVAGTLATTTVYAGNGPDDNFPPVCTNPSNADGHHTDEGDPGHSGGPGHGTGKDCSSNSLSGGSSGGSSSTSQTSNGIAVPGTGSGVGGGLLLVVAGSITMLIARRKLM